MNQNQNMDFRDNEISADTDNKANKKACSVESTMEKLNGNGLTDRELTKFVISLTGTY